MPKEVFTMMSRLRLNLKSKRSIVKIKMMISSKLRMRKVKIKKR